MLHILAEISQKQDDFCPLDPIKQHVISACPITDGVYAGHLIKSGLPSSGLGLRLLQLAMYAGSPSFSLCWGTDTPARLPLCGMPPPPRSPKPGCSAPPHLHSSHLSSHPTCSRPCKLPAGSSSPQRGCDSCPAELPLTQPGCEAPQGRCDTLLPPQTPALLAKGWTVQGSKRKDCRVFFTCILDSGGFILPINNFSHFKLIYHSNRFKLYDYLNNYQKRTG